jgi:putative ABC transport system permease protein
MESDLDDELRFHLEKQIEANLAAGMLPAAARLAALKEFGNPRLQQEECRDAWGTRMIDNLFDDVRYALRGLRRDPILAVAATATLALCIGANTVVFSLVNSILLRPLPYPGADRIHFLSEHIGRENMEVTPGGDYYSTADQGRLFEAVAAYAPFTENWTGIDKPEQLDAAQVSASFFKVMGAQPMMGRYLAAGEEGQKAPAVVVLSYALWRNRMGGDPNVIGSSITLDRLPNTVIGVMPQGFDFPRGAQIWKPLPIDESSQRPRSAMRPQRIVNMVARVKRAVGERELASEMLRLTETIRAEYPQDFQSAGFVKGMSIVAVPLQKRLVGDLRQALLVLTGAVALVLLIACVNLANLLLARAGTRRRELAVRLALGSDRGCVIRQLLTESLLLALPGGLAGAGLAGLTVSLLNVAKPAILVRYPTIAIDLRTLLFTFGLTLLTGLIFGMAPALSAARIDIQEALKSGGSGQSSGPRAARLRQGLVVVELGVSLVLLIGAGLLARSFLKLAHTDLGFDPARLLTVRVNLVGDRYAKADGQMQFYDDVLDRLQQNPLVKVAAVSTDLPLSGERPFTGGGIQVAGRPPVPAAQAPHANTTVVSRDFFRTFGIPLESGRTFDSSDNSQSSNAVIVNQAFARKIFPGENPVGQRLLFGRDGSVVEVIVGVVGNICGSALGAEPEPVMYRCLCQGGNRFLTRMALLVRTSGEPRAAIRDVEAQVYAEDRNQPVFDVKTMEERLEDATAGQRFQLLLIGTFAGLALVLAAAGVYGVMSYLVTRRTRELGIRIALGARPEDVMRHVLGENLMLVLVAVAAGLGGAWVLTRYLKTMLYGVTTLDTPTLAVAPLILAATVIGASLGPARRAARVDPMVALREE